MDYNTEWYMCIITKIHKVGVFSSYVDKYYQNLFAH